MDIAPKLRALEDIGAEWNIVDTLDEAYVTLSACRYT